MKTKTKKSWHRLGAMLLSLCLIIGMMPVNALASQTEPFIFGYKAGGGPIVSISTENQSDYTKIAEYDDSLLGLEIIDGNIYGLSSNHDFSEFKLVILNPDFTVKETVGNGIGGGFVIVDTAVQNGNLYGVFNDASLNSYVVPISLTTGKIITNKLMKINGLPAGEIIYTIACNAAGQMYAIVADGGDFGGSASLYTIDTSSGEASKVGNTGVNTNWISSSAFAPDGTLYWAENDSKTLYTVNTDTGKVTAVTGGNSVALNAMMIPEDSNTAAYIKFIVKGEDGTISLDGKEVSGLQKVTAGEDLELTFTPGNDNKIKEVVVDGEKQGVTDSYTFNDVSAWSKGIHTVEVSFQSKNISIISKNDCITYLGKHTLNMAPSFLASLYFDVVNGPARNTGGVSNYQTSIEKDGVIIDPEDLVPGTYDIHVTREADADWNGLDTVLQDGFTITKQTLLQQWEDLEMTAKQGDTLADIEKPDYLISPLDGKKIPGTFYWIDDESTSAGELGDRTGFKFRFVPDTPLSEELAALYDFSNMPANGFEFTAYVTVAENGINADSITLPVRVLDEGDVEYSPAPKLTATFTPDSAVSVGEFNQWQGLAIDYRKEDTQAYGPVSQGYDFQAIYTVTIPLENYQGETLSGTLTVPLPEGYDGATARIKGGAKASSYTKDTVSFPVTLDVSGGVAEKFELVIEYKEAQESASAPEIIKGANGKWQQGSEKGLSFTSNAEFADFIKVQVDGKDLDASDYTLKEGSTIVTLNADYLNTLSVGKHTLAIVSTTGTATTEFTVTGVQSGGNAQSSSTASQDTDGKDKTTTSPKTGDNNDIMMWIALLFVSGGVLSGTFIVSKKRFTKN